MTTLTQWVAADGTIIALDGTAGVTVQRGVTGLDSPPMMNTRDQRVNSDGAVLVRTRRTERQVTLPLYFDLSSITMGQIASAFQGPGTLVSSNGRQLRNVIYDGGLEAAWTVDTGGVEGLGFRKANLNLLALDPWWYGEVATNGVGFITGTSLVSPTGWDDAISWDAVLPWDGGSTFAVVVEGDAPASPRFYIAISFDSLTFSNGARGVTLAQEVGPTEVITVDSRHGHRGPYFGTDLLPGAPPQPMDWTLITQDSQLFDLPVGTSSIIYNATGTTGFSSFGVAWEPRWLVP